MTNAQLTGKRREFYPTGPVCRTCPYLGSPIRVTDTRGASRILRACDQSVRAATDPDRAACERHPDMETHE